jgi:hypothetical protein
VSGLPDFIDTTGCLPEHSAQRSSKLQGFFSRHKAQRMAAIQLTDRRLNTRSRKDLVLSVTRFSFPTHSAFAG